MSAIEPARRRTGWDPQAPPAFALEWRPDDPEDPERVTVFDPADERITTEWITVDREVAVSLEEVR